MVWAYAILLAVALSAIGYASPASASATGWSLLESSLSLQASTRPSVSCDSTRMCVSVSSTWTGMKRLPAAALWTGEVWEDDEAIFPGGKLEASLEGVSCPSAKVCFAVGHAATVPGEGVTLVERSSNAKDGEWAVQETPNPAEAVDSNLASVSCTSIRSCTAVGYYYTGTNDQETLAEHWNGRAWAIEKTPNPTEANETGLLGSTLSSVSCTSKVSCTAVGSYHTKSLNQRMLAERWNGDTWTIEETPSPVEATESELEGVSCASADSCTAVGDVVISATSHASAERWNGTEWAFEKAASSSGDGILASVSCVSSESCTAVGWYSVEQALTLAEHWDGATWAIQETPNAKKSRNSRLEGVSCPAKQSCVATGQAEIASSSSKNSLLAEQYSD
jgi:hypothetical protein